MSGSAKTAAKTAEAKIAPKKVEKMHPELHAKLAEYRKARNFDVKKWVQAKCEMFNAYMSKSGLKACVISVSGGVDSAVMTALCKRAMDMKDSPIKRVMAVAQPIHSSGWALARAEECCKALDVEMKVVDGTKVYDALKALVDEAVGITGKDFAGGQLRSYQRTPVGYYVAQLLSQNGTPAVVMGTGNMDEDGYLMYYCKAGDGVVDIQLIADLHKSEVFAVGRECGVVASIIEAKPSADLWAGQSDEDELGVTYDFVELFTGHYLKLSKADKKAFEDSLGADAQKQFAEWAERARTVHRRNRHKADSPLNLDILPTVLIADE